MKLINLIIVTVILLALLTYVTSAAVVNAVDCDLCTTLITFAEHYIESNSTETYIQEKLAKICADIPSKFEGVCCSVVDYVPKVIDMVVNKFTPEAICKDIRLC